MHSVRSRSWLLGAALVALSCASAARANVLTFVGPYGAPVAATVEGNFTYDTFSGALYRDNDANGDAFDMEGCSNCGTGGGVLRVVRNDLLGGLFTFDASDIRFEFSQAHAITFVGLLGGVSQGSDVFMTTADSTWSTIGANVLAGVAIDELRVVLDASPSTAADIDNLVLTAIRVPEPATIALVGLALAGLGFSRRKR